MNYWLTVAEDQYIVQKVGTNIIVKSPYGNYLYFSIDLEEHIQPATGMRHYSTKLVLFLLTAYVFQEEKDNALKAAKNFLGIP
jgi:hypothetical protein